METLGESTEPPEQHTRSPCFDASQYSFFSGTTPGLELDSRTGLEEGVEAPPEEDFFKTPSTELDNSFVFEAFYDGNTVQQQQPQQQPLPQLEQQGHFSPAQPPEPPPVSSLPLPVFPNETASTQRQSILFVSDLEKQLQSSASLKAQNNSTSSSKAHALTVTEVENQNKRTSMENLLQQVMTSTSHATNAQHIPQGPYPFSANTGSSTNIMGTAGGLFQFQNAIGSYGYGSSDFLQTQPPHQQQHQIGSIGSSSQHSMSGFPSQFTMTGSAGGGGASGSLSMQHQTLPFAGDRISGFSLYNQQNAHVVGTPTGGGGSVSLQSIMTGSTTMTPGVQKYKFMSSSEIEKILSFQIQNVHVQNPYSDDYYYHAFIKKYRRGSCRFTPISFKEAEHQEQAMKAEVKFADLQGLGKIPFSNLRTPRPLIDFLDNESLASAEEDEALHSIQWEFIRSAHRQQAMQARKLIEDSMCLLLEVDDVDRLATSECGKVDLRKLASRRRDLIGSIVEAFRIPSTPEGKIPTPNTGGKYVVNSDGVFLRLMSIAKGRSLLAKLLNVLVPPRPFQALPTDTNPLSHICWTTLRNIRALFGPPTWITKQGIDVDISSLTAETSKIAAGLKEVILALRSANDVCRAFEALAKGDLMSSSDGSVVTPEDLLLPFLPPNHIPGRKTGIWLEQVLVALLQRALEVGLAQRICFTHPTGAFIDFDLMMKWDEVFGVLYQALTAHLKILGQVQLVAKERNQPQALQYADGLRGRELLKAALTLCNHSQLFQLKQLVSALL